MPTGLLPTPCPTATHQLVDTHETPESDPTPFSLPPPLSGLATTVHTPRSPDSMRPPAYAIPTATHHEAGQLTDNRPLKLDPRP
jgi:hypothetical protein